MADAGRNAGQTVASSLHGHGAQSQTAYGAALAGSDGVSFNRSPDLAGTSYALHTSVGSTASSAGTRASGAAY